jgi:hypothetical protein
LVIINQDSTFNYRGEELALVGYREMDLSGGDGAVDGGGGGFVLVQNELSSVSPLVNAIGGIESQVGLKLLGGDGTTGAGGSGGLVGFSVNDPTPGNINPLRSIINRGAIDASGGSCGGAANAGGNGGAIAFYDRYRVENRATIQVNGGAGNVGSGGSGGQIDIASDDVVVNTSALTAEGASGDEDGGFGGVIGVIGRTSSSSASLSADAGDGGAGGGDVGGTGGFIEILSTETASVVRGTLSARLGDGTTPGLVGVVVVDGITVALTGGAITY